MSQVLQSIAPHAAATPNKTAIVSKGEGDLSYKLLQRAVSDTVAQLVDTTVRGRPFAIVCDNGPAWLILDLALIKLNVPSLPLPSFFTTSQRDHALTQCGASHLLSDHLIEGHDPTYEIAVLGKPLFLTELQNAPKDIHVGTGKITYTSGTTGSPKGVCLSQCAMETTANSIVAHLTADGSYRHMAVLPLSILLENVAGFYATMLVGGCYVVDPQDDIGFGSPFQVEFDKLIEGLKNRKAKSVIFVPEILRGLIAALGEANAKLPDLDIVAVGGAKVSKVLLLKAREMGLPVLEGYGLSEASSVISLNSFKDNVLGTVGKPLEHIDWSIADDGELILSVAPFLGYVGEAAHTGSYRTGDIVSFDDGGRLTIVGRSKSTLINSFGRNIAPEWVESELTEQPEIAQALVFGDAMPSLAALVVPSSLDVSPHDIAKAIKRTNRLLPEYAHVSHWKPSTPFTPSNGQLTGTGRIRRAVIMKEKENIMTTSYSNLNEVEGFFDRLVRETEPQRREFMSIPIIQSGLKGEIDRDAYVAYLSQAYHHVKHTVPLMGTVKSRVPTERAELHDALNEYIDEEHGH